MDDLHRPPTDRDREQLAARINRVHDEGRIGAADRDIRLGNVRSAQSMAELDLMVRDLDQLETALPAAPVGPWSTFDPKAVASSGGGVGRRTGIVLALVVALAVVVAGVAAVIGFAGSDSSSTASDEVPAAPATQGDPTEDPATTGDVNPDPGPKPSTKYSLTGPGIRGFLAIYRQKFRTSRVVDLSLYDDYAIVRVPVRGKPRQAGWLYRNTSGWTAFGNVSATFPGAVVVDTDRLDIPALVRNIARARRTLNVEKPHQTYVIVRHYSTAEPVPSVDIHIGNAYQEHGYLATTLDGQVERAYPYAR